MPEQPNCIRQTGRSNPPAGSNFSPGGPESVVRGRDSVTTVVLPYRTVILSV